MSVYLELISVVSSPHLLMEANALVNLIFCSLRDQFCGVPVRVGIDGWPVLAEACDEHTC